MTQWMHVSLFAGVKMHVTSHASLKTGRVRIRCYNGMKMSLPKNSCDAAISVQVVSTDRSPFGSKSVTKMVLKTSPFFGPLVSQHDTSFASLAVLHDAVGGELCVSPALPSRPPFCILTLKGRLSLLFKWDKTALAA